VGDANQQQPIETEPSAEAGRSAALDLDNPAAQLLFQQAILLLEKYSFEIIGCSARAFVTYWADDLPIGWIRLAILEALYLGRYKAVSVSQILALWERKGQPQPHFNAEFERLICHHLDETFGSESSYKSRKTQPSLPLSELQPDLILESDPMLTSSELFTSHSADFSGFPDSLVPSDSPPSHLSKHLNLPDLPQKKYENTGEESIRYESGNHEPLNQPLKQPSNPSPNQPLDQTFEPNSGVIHSSTSQVNSQETRENFERSVHPAEIEQFIPDADLSVELHDKLRGLAQLPSWSEEPDSPI